MLRRDILDAALSPAGPAMANAEYKGLIASMAAPGVTAEMAARELSNFLDAGQRLPAFALKAACASFRNGTIGDGRWMPKIGEVVREANRLVAEVAKERRDVNYVLEADVEAPVVDPEQRAANLANALRFIAEGREMDAATRIGTRNPEAERIAKTHAEALRMAIATGKPDPRPIPPLSPSLRLSLGLPELSPDMVSDRVPDLPARVYDAA